MSYYDDFKKAELVQFCDDFNTRNKNLQQTVEHLDKVLLEKTLEIRTLNHHLMIQNQRVDALLAALCGNHIELRRLQTEHVFKPENESRFEFKNNKWQVKKDSVAVAG
jgi:hypothetical protein